MDCFVLTILNVWIQQWSKKNFLPIHFDGSWVSVKIAVALRLGFRARRQTAPLRESLSLERRLPTALWLVARAWPLFWAVIAPCTPISFGPLAMEQRDAAEKGGCGRGGGTCCTHRHLDLRLLVLWARLHRPRAPVGALCSERSSQVKGRRGSPGNERKKSKPGLAEAWVSQIPWGTPWSSYSSGQGRQPVIPFASQSRAFGCSVVWAWLPWSSCEPLQPTITVAGRGVHTPILWRELDEAPIAFTLCLPESEFCF